MRYKLKLSGAQPGTNQIVLPDEIVNNLGTNIAVWHQGRKIPSHKTTRSLSFDGTDDYANIFANETVPAEFRTLGNNNSYAVSFRIKTTDTSSGSADRWWATSNIVDFRASHGTPYEIPFCIGLEAGKIRYGRADISGGSGAVGTNSIADGKWHFVEVSVNDDDVEIFIDGELDKSYTFTSDTGNASVGTASSRLTLGCRRINDGSATSFFNGELSYFSINFGGTILEYLFEDTSTTISDTISSNDASVSGATWQDAGELCLYTDLPYATDDIEIGTGTSLPFEPEAANSAEVLDWRPATGAYWYFPRSPFYGMKVKVDSTWKQVADMKVKIAGEWKEVTGVWHKQAGSWNKVGE